MKKLVAYQNSLIEIGIQTFSSEIEECANLSLTGMNIYSPNISDVLTNDALDYVNNYLNIPKEKDKLILHIQSKWETELSNNEKQLIVTNWKRHYETMFSQSSIDFNELNLIPSSTGELVDEIHESIKEALKLRGSDQPLLSLKNSKFPSSYQNHISKNESDKFTIDRLQEFESKIINTQYCDMKLMNKLYAYKDELLAKKDNEGVNSPVLPHLDKIIVRIESEPLYKLSHFLLNYSSERGLNISLKELEKISLHAFTEYEKLNEGDRLSSLIPKILADKAFFNKLQELPEYYNKTFSYLGVSSTYESTRVKAYELKVGSKSRYMIGATNSSEGRIYLISDIQSALELPDDHTLLSYQNHARKWFQIPGFFESCDEVKEDELNTQDTSITIEDYIEDLNKTDNLFTKLRLDIQNDEFNDIDDEDADYKEKNENVTESGTESSISVRNQESLENVLLSIANVLNEKVSDYQIFLDTFIQQTFLKKRIPNMNDVSLQGLTTKISAKDIRVLKSHLNQLKKDISALHTDTGVQLTTEERINMVTIPLIENRLLFYKSICEEIRKADNTAGKWIEFGIDKDVKSKERIVFSMLTPDEKRLILFTTTEPVIREPVTQTTPRRRNRQLIIEAREAEVKAQEVSIVRNTEPEVHVETAKKSNYRNSMIYTLLSIITGYLIYRCLYEPTSKVTLEINRNPEKLKLNPEKWISEEDLKYEDDSPIGDIKKLKPNPEKSIPEVKHIYEGNSPIDDVSWMELLESDKSLQHDVVSNLENTTLLTRVLASEDDVITRKILKLLNDITADTENADKLGENILIINALINKLDSNKPFIRNSAINVLTKVSESLNNQNALISNTKLINAMVKGLQTSDSTYHRKLLSIAGTLSKNKQIFFSKRTILIKEIGQFLHLDDDFIKGQAKTIFIQLMHNNLSLLQLIKIPEFTSYLSTMINSADPDLGQLVGTIINDMSKNPDYRLRMRNDGLFMTNLIAQIMFSGFSSVSFHLFKNIVAPNNKLEVSYPIANIGSKFNRTNDPIKNEMDKTSMAIVAFRMISEENMSVDIFQNRADIIDATCSILSSKSKLTFQIGVHMIHYFSKLTQHKDIFDELSQIDTEILNLFDRLPNEERLYLFKSLIKMSLVQSLHKFFSNSRPLLDKLLSLYKSVPYSEKSLIVELVKNLMISDEIKKDILVNVHYTASQDLQQKLENTW